MTIKEIRIEIGLLPLLAIAFLIFSIALLIYSLSVAYGESQQEEYKFVKCPNDNNTYPEGTNCNVDPLEESYDDWKEKTYGKDDDDDDEKKD